MGENDDNIMRVKPISVEDMCEQSFHNDPEGDCKYHINQKDSQVSPLNIKSNESPTDSTTNSRSGSKRSQDILSESNRDNLAVFSNSDSSTKMKQNTEDTCSLRLPQKRNYCGDRFIPIRSNDDNQQLQFQHESEMLVY